MDFPLFISVLEKAREKEEEDRIWDLYLIEMPNSKEKMGFDDYLKKARVRQLKAAQKQFPGAKKKAAEVISIAERIKRADLKGRGVSR